MKKEPRNSRNKYKIKLHPGSDEDRTENAATNSSNGLLL